MASRPNRIHKRNRHFSTVCGRSLHSCVAQSHAQLVLLEHRFGRSPSPILRLFWFITVLGSESVVVFFVLSGFLVGGSIRRSMREERSTGPTT